MNLALLSTAAALAFSATVAFSRDGLLLDKSWKFRPGECPGAEQATFDDRSWDDVTIPHNWGWKEAQEGKEYYRGPGWYRRSLDIGAPKSGSRYFVRFGAAGSVADVYVNGVFLGEHRGAFGAFCYEITQQLSKDGHNVLAVRTDNSAQSDVAPLSGDFDIFGGLYRPVNLIETNDVCFALTDHASPGIAWRQTEVSKEQAVIDLDIEVSNGSNTHGRFTLAAMVYDASGSCISTVEVPIVVTPNVTAPYSLKLALLKPHLWNGRKDPYLYRGVVQLRAGDGSVIDSVAQPLGLRFYRVDPDEGFFLNGEPYHLHGVCKHQDRQDKGWAISEADMREDIALVKDIGATAIRCAHYQHSDYFYGLCDSAGILVWAEIPQVNEINPSPEFAETSRNQLLDLIRQNINHPSIFAWSLFNELWPGRPDPHREVMDLNILAHGEDPGRPTIAATSNEELAQMDKIPDLLGWNIYCGWYPGWGPKEAFGEYLDRGRTISKHGGLCISEYGAGANVEHHEEPATQPKTDGQWHPEEWQAILHEAAWSAMKARPFVWGTFVWNMFDFAVHSRNEGGIPGRNDKGLVTYDRKTKKDAFFFYRANWSSEPTVYIASRRFVRRTEPTTEVKVYSNADQVELFVNGTSKGKITSEGNCVFLWKGTRLDIGENKVEARATIGGHEVADRCTWSLRPPSKHKE